MKPVKQDQQSNGSTLTSTQFFNALNKYIPSLVLQNMIDQQKNDMYEQEAQSKGKQGTKSQITSLMPKKQQLPHIQDMETVVLFADISGFTNVSEACAKHGIRGNEELAFCINRYMEGMVKNLAKFGGDIIKFVGDAMIVMWPRSKWKKDDPDGNDEEEKINVIRKSIQCACDIQKEMNNKKIMANVTNLSVKIGIAFGKCALLYVGGVFERSEFFTVGTALTYALKSEEQATAGGQIIVSDTAFRYVKNQYYEGQEIISDEGKKFFRITGVKQGVRGRADAVLLKSQIKIDRMTGIQKSLKSCVPAAIMPFIEIGYEQFGSETRALTVLFASLGVDLSSASSIEGMNKIQKIVTTVQQQVYRLEGSLNKLVMDDKGSTLICIWGLCPMAHTDDPQRAILTAMNMRRELAKIEGTWCNCGLATGDVFSGVVGTQGSRKEFSVLGDVVNLAARIMFWPKKFKQVGKINCDMRTKNEAMNTISFNYGGHCEFKGKSISIPIFEPIDPEDEFNVREGQYLNKIIPPQAFLKLHYNPLVVQKSLNHKKNNSEFVGKQNFINEIYDQIKSFFFSHKGPDRKPLATLITGESGSGKTHLMRALCEKVARDQDFIREANMNHQCSKKELNASQSMMRQSKLALFASTVNSESRMKFLGAWRPILRNILEFKSRDQRCSKAYLLRNICAHHLDKVDLILEIFGQVSGDKEKDKLAKEQILKQMKTEEQIQNLSEKNPIGFLLPQKYNNQVTDSLIDQIVYFIKDFLGEEQECSSSSNDNTVQSNSSKLNSEKLSNLVSKNKLPNNDHKKPPCILIFDQASLMDEESWCVLLRIYSQCSNIALILLVDQDFKGNPIIPTLKVQKQANFPGNALNVPYYTTDIPVAQMFIDDAIVFDIPSLNYKDFRQMLVELAPKYFQSFSEEIGLMTHRVNPETSIKSVEQCEEWLKLLTKQYNLERVWRDVDSEIMRIVLNKCAGNTIICLQFFFNLLVNGYIEVDKDNKVVPKKTFEMSVQLQNFTKLPVPSNAIKKRLKNMDNFLKQGRAKKNIRKQEIAVKGLMLMKAAAIIGEEFGTQALKKILPLRQETHGSMLIILKELEQGELIEILDETDPKNILCRFNQSFLRESIYQIMLYRDQKKVLHQQLAEYMQSLPSSVMDMKQIDLEIHKIRDHILIGEDVKHEKDLPFKQKYGIIVKQMQSMLIKNNNKIILYKSFVLKQGKKASKKISKRLMLLTAKEITWFHNVKEYENNFPPLGLIQVENIYKCQETTLQSQTYDFELSVTSYIKKGILENQTRTIKFACETENDRHHWISRIEFLKAKMVYENYVNKFVNIQFPLKKEEDVDEDDSEQKKDIIYEKLHQFGKNFKQNARINHQTVNLLVNKQSSSFGKSLVQNSSILRGSRQSISNVQVMRQSSNSFLEQQDNGHQSREDLAQKIGKLYTASMVCVLNQTTVNANKNQQLGKNKPIGRVPEYFQPDWMFETHSANSSPERNLSIIDTQSMGINKTEGRKNSFTLKPARPKPRNSVRTPTPDANIQEIKEQSEGSSSGGELKPKINHQKQNRGSQNYNRLPKSTLVEREISADATTMRNQGLSSQEKTSGNSVSVQLKMLDEKPTPQQFKQIPQRDSRGFTFSQKEPVGDIPTHIRPVNSQHFRGGSYGFDSQVLNDSRIQGSALHYRESSGGDQNNFYGEREMGQSQRFQPNNVGVLNQGHLHQENISEIPRAMNESEYLPQPMNNQFQMNPVIQQEISNQINQGLMDFFRNLDQKLLEQKQNTGQALNNNNGIQRNLSMQNVFENTQTRQNKNRQQFNSPPTHLSTPMRSELINRGVGQNMQFDQITPIRQDTQSSYTSQGVATKNKRVFNEDSVPQSKQNSVYSDEDLEPMDPMVEEDSIRVQYK